MNDILKALRSEKMGKERFTVDRVVFTRQYGHLDQDRSSYRVSGCVQEATPEQAKLAFGEYQGRKILRIFAPFQFTAGEELGPGPSYLGADRIHRGGQTYRVLKTRHWRKYGFSEAWAEEMEQEPEDD